MYNIEPKYPIAGGNPHHHIQLLGNNRYKLLVKGASLVAHNSH